MPLHYLMTCLLNLESMAHAVRKVQEISKFFTLKIGDVIFTGTPAMDFLKFLFSKHFIQHWFNYLVTSNTSGSCWV